MNEVLPRAFLATSPGKRVLKPEFTPDEAIYFLFISLANSFKIFARAEEKVRLVLRKVQWQQRVVKTNQMP